MKHVRTPIVAVIVALCFIPAGTAAQIDLRLELEKAKSAMESGRYLDAARHYREAVNALPGDPGLRFNLGLALHSAGRHPHAVQELELVLQMSPEMTRARFILALARLKLQDVEGAIPLLKEVVQLEPDNQPALLELGNAYFMAKQHRNASEAFLDLVKRSSHLPAAWHGLGMSYAALAGEYFEELESMAPESSYVAFLRGHSRLRQKRYRSAFYFLRQALEREPFLRGIHSRVAEIYREIGETEWAEIEIEKEYLLPPVNCENEALECAFQQDRYLDLIALAREQEGKESRFWLARAYEELALASFLELSNLPASVEVHSLKARALRIRGLYELAIEEWKQAVSLEPENQRIQEELAFTYWQSGAFQEAEGLYRKLRDRVPDDPDFNFYLGRSLLRLRRFAEALPILTKALERAAEGTVSTAEMQLALGQTHFHLNNWEEAVPLLETAQSLDPSGAVHYQLARAYDSLGRQEEAADSLESFRRVSNERARNQQKDFESFRITPP